MLPLWLCHSLLPWLHVPFKQPVHVSRNELFPPLSSWPFSFLCNSLGCFFKCLKKADHTVLAHLQLNLESWPVVTKSSDTNRSWDCLSHAWALIVGNPQRNKVILCRNFRLIAVFVSVMFHQCKACCSKLLRFSLFLLTVADGGGGLPRGR